MSRRKQARPIKVEEGGLPTPTLPNGESCSGSEDELLGSAQVLCPHCQSEFQSYSDLVEHSKDCVGKSCPSPPSIASDDEFDGEKRQEEARRHRQDAENNNSVEEDDGEVGFPLGHVTLEALQNTKVAVAQFAATAMANNADNPAALQELAVLQSTLYTLQHQQMMQLNLIQQLQQQLQITRPKEGSPSSPPPMSGPSRTPTPVRQDVPPTPPTCQSLPASQSTPSAPPKAVSSPPIPPVSLPPCSISSSFASSIITNLDPPPSPSEPNTLEMLQKRAQEVLDNASQGLLASNLADELAFRKNGGKGSLSPYDSKTGGRNEPFFKHRCRYCGKVFGSDSALQIHIRSHTGERPFKCNVCGSRFTTKGNLKVHFQRHSAKFPHIKMNPNPVPEHLDKYHPPLLAQMGAHQSHPAGPPHPPYSGGPQFPTGLPLYRPPPPHDLVLPPHPRPPHDSLNKPILPLPVFGPQEMPENLSKASPDRYKEESRIIEEMKDERLSPKQEPKLEVTESERYPSPPPYDDCSLDSKYTSEDVPGERDSPGLEKNEDSQQDQPENLSNKSTSDIGHFSFTPDPRLPPPVHFPEIVSPTSSTSSGSVHRGFLSSTHEPDPIKDPAIYSSLLPRPGSTDNSWESLIEITKTSETHKLQQLVDNIENKMIDPNQCVICHRVLSCKSALQMHYRTHTGERPFKCRICGRSFTTKGNLKTHMGVHRVKPPMRMLHQCPVCHKKFTNSLVLQQHIRLHTGEPTDLTPEQIQAAEIRDFIPQIPSSEQHFRPFQFPQHLSLPRDPPSLPGLDLPPRSPSPPYNPQEEDKPDYLDESRASSVSPISDAAFSTSITALENQVRTITTIASHYTPSKLATDSIEDLSSNKDNITVNGEKSPASRGLDSPSGSEGPLTPSPLHPSNSALYLHRLPTSPSPASESSSLGALDLTPRSGGPPPGLFSGFGIMPPGSMASSSPLITSALSSLTSSVLTTTAFNPLGLAVGPPGKSPGRGNTTCNLCFKTFACNSALEIHYRSHTKERPFKCTICDRGFSTKGNMKQHMLTHKIRDMPAHLFEQKNGGSGTSGPATCGGGGAPQCTQPPPREPMQSQQAQTQPQPQPQPQPLPLVQPQPQPQPPPQQQPQQLTMPPQIQHPHRQTPPQQQALQPSTPILPLPPTHQSQQTQSLPPPPPQQPQPPPPQQQQMAPQHHHHHHEDRQSGELSPIPLHHKPEIGVKRSPPQGDTASMPLPKRQPSLPKHLCHVCNKNFSSSSALQIHMRTHTGDKPFRCSICLKAFTTKGNLKVHMGTHMWSNGASRRGRRMSLEIPPLPKDSEFLQRRPDFFYPYLPAPFLNGIHQKLSEMPMGGSGGGHNGMMSYCGFPGELKGEPRSPEKTTHQGATPPSLWDLHLKQDSHHADEPSPPPSMPPPRGEGLAA